MKKLLFIFVLLCMELNAEMLVDAVKKMTVEQKKQRFYSIVIPVVDKIYTQRYELYQNISLELNQSDNNTKIEDLKAYYNVKTDQELLMALKPQPKSIAIAQAAIESAWGTSRFFKIGNNLFGMWSTSKKEQRMAAKEKRANKKTVWLKKYNSLEDSVNGYYLTLAKGKRYHNLRKLNYKSDDVFKIIKGLDRYSERGKAYVDEIEKIIKHNKLTKYDKKQGN